VLAVACCRPAGRRIAGAASISNWFRSAIDGYVPGVHGRHEVEVEGWSDTWFWWCTCGVGWVRASHLTEAAALHAARRHLARTARCAGDSVGSVLPAVGESVAHW